MGRNPVRPNGVVIFGVGSCRAEDALFSASTGSWRPVFVLLLDSRGPASAHPRLGGRVGGGFGGCKSSSGKSAPVNKYTKREREKGTGMRMKQLNEARINGGKLLNVSGISI